MLKHLAQVATTTLVKAKLHAILARFPDYELGNLADRDEIINAILESLGGAIGGAMDLFTKGNEDGNDETGEDENPFY